MAVAEGDSKIFDVAVLNIERDLLHTVMSDNSDWDHVCDILLQAHFSPNNGLVYATICQLINSCKLSGLDAVEAQLLKNARTRPSGSELRAQMVQATIRPARQMAVFLREQFALREIHRVGELLTAQSAPDASASTLLGNAIEHLSTLQEQLPCSESATLDSLIVRRLDLITEAVDAGVLHDSSPQSLEQLLLNPEGQYPREGLVVGLVGEKSTGKTTLAVQVFAQLTMAGTPGVFFSAEMPAQAISDKFLAFVSQIPLRQLTSGQLDDAQWSPLCLAVEVMGKAAYNIILDEERPSLGEITQQCTTTRRRYGLGIVVVDHLKCCKLLNGQTYEEWMIEIKAMARRLKCTVLVISHEAVFMENSADLVWRLGKDCMLQSLKTRYSDPIRQQLAFQPDIARFAMATTGDLLTPAEPSTNDTNRPPLSLS